MSGEQKGAADALPADARLSRHEAGRNPVWATRIAVACLAIIALVATAHALLTRTQWGREQLAGLLQRGLSNMIPGVVEVDRIERATWKELEVAQLVFRAPGGASVLTIERATLRVGRAALLVGDIDISKADVEGGVLRIEESPDGSVPLEQAFSSAGGDPSETDISIRNVRVRNLRVVVAPASGPTLHVENVHALTRIERPPRQGVEVRFDQVTGSVVKGIPLGELELKRVQGRVRGKAKHVVEIEGPAHLAGDDFELRVDYYDRDKSPVVLGLGDLDVSALGVAAVGANALAELLPVGVEVDLGADDAKQ